MPTIRMSIPQLAEGQASPEVTLNSALNVIDMLLHAAIKNTTGGITAPTAPPGSPAEGDTYIVPASATGAWSGYTGYLAGYYSGGWIFVAPKEGMRVRHLADNYAYYYDGTNWQAVATTYSRTTIG